MATDDVPGANPANRDKLAMGCWAEHGDGSLIFVESVEGGNVVYSIFDTSRSPVIEYRDAMREPAFKKQFSWRPEGGDRWTWHDKTPFPWDRVMRRFPAGSRVASAGDLATAAQRVAEARGLGRDDEREVDPDTIEHLREQQREAQAMINRIQSAIDSLEP